jgi:hypothetical protein
MLRLAAAIAPLVVVACPAPKCTPPSDTYDPGLQASTLSTNVDNPLWPLVPGTVFTFGGAEDVTVSVTSQSKSVLGVPVVAVQDTVREGGEVVEDTFDWYAQDQAGNVWYMGEDTKEYRGGEVSSTAGSWEAGVDGAEPGIVMQAHAAVGQRYRQEFLACEAEDEAEVIAAEQEVTVPYGTLTGCLQTHELTRLEPDVSESKYYCPGIGLVLEVNDHNGDRVELQEVQAP